MKSGRTVLFVCPVGTRGGAESVLLALWSQLDRWGVEPVAFFLRDGPLVEEARRLGLRVYLNQIPRLLAPRAFVRAVAAIRRCATETRAVAIVNTLGYAHLYGSLAARLAGVHSIWWSHALATRTQWLDRFAATLPTDLVITVSERARAAHLRLYPAARVLVVRPGVVGEPSESAAGSPTTGLRAELGIGAEEKVICSLGRLETGKGQDVLVRAAALLVGEIPGIRVLLAGGPGGNGANPFAASLVGLVEQLGLRSHVSFLGARDDVPRLLASTDLYVHPARYPESFGMAVLEAMASGKPVIATRVGGPEEIIGESRGGLLVDPDNAEALAGAMRTLLKDERLCAEMATRAVLRARAFDAGRMTADFCHALDEGLGTRGAA